VIKNNKKIIYIHLGYPKTATTFLQEKIFNKLKNVVYLGKPYQNNFDKSFNYLFQRNVSLYNKKKNKIKELFKSFNKNKNYLISDEAFLSTSVEIHEPFLAVKRLKQLIKNHQIKVFFSIRNQGSILLSDYAEDRDTYARMSSSWKKWNTLLTIFNKNKKKNNNQKKFLNLLNYHKTYKRLVKLFGRKNVNFLFYEEMLFNQSKFYKSLFLILNLKKKEISKYDNKKKINITQKHNDNAYIIGGKKNLIYEKILSNIKNLEIFTSPLKKINTLIKIVTKKKEIIFLNKNQADLIKKYFLNNNKKLDKNFRKLKQYNYL